MPARKLRVLFLATRDSNHPGTTGGDNTLWATARYLASAGHAVTYVAASYPGAAKRAVIDGVAVVRLGGIHSMWLTTFVYYMRHCRGRYDVVIAEGFGGSRIPRWTPLYVREPIVTEWHQIHRDLFAIQYPRLLNGPLNLLENLTARIHRNTLVRAGTTEWKEEFPTIGFKPENVFVVPVSIPEDWISNSAVSPRPPTILWIGKLRRYKCPDHAVRAMASVLKQVPNAKLVLAIRHDDLAYERQLRSLVADLQLQAHVEFRFNVSETEKRDLLRSARVLVVPSAVEGFGIVVLEANASGAPVVASTGVPEGAVRDGSNGLRYRFGRIDELSAALVRVLTDNALHDSLARNGIAFAKEFTWAKVGAQYESVLQRAVAGRTHMGAA